MFDLNTLLAIRAKLLAEGKLADALKVAVFATQEFPESFSAWYALAELHLQTGDVAPARDALTRCLAIAPRNARARALRERIESADAAVVPENSCGCGAGCGADS